jgi:D-arabinose 1-dehydrogenase-like Zn-dependent alcohol dehydrogenase
MMQAARFDATTKTLSIKDVPVPEPGPGEVRVAVRACGICLSDVHLIDGSLPAPLPEVTPGHEAAGVIERVGPGVPWWRPGQRVVMAGGKSCGACAGCATGGDCAAPQIMGFGYDGAWAEFVVVPYGCLTEVPEDIPLDQAAVLADAVATPYAGLIERAELRVGEAVGLWGLGGLGTHAVQIARMAGAAPIIGIDPLPAARERALSLGADHVLDPADGDIPDRVRALTGGLQLAVDLVGANAVLAQGAACLRHSGRLLMVGLSLEPVVLGPGLFFGLASHSLLGHLGYQKRHLDALVPLVSAGRLDLSRSVSEILPLAEVARGVQTLVRKQGNPVRLVVTP